MFSTKLEVDRHVENCLKKINGEMERNLRCLAFAKLYFKVGDYEQARRYVSSYLNAKPLSAEGKLLLGKIMEKLGKKDAALEAYRSSYEIDSKQNNLVIKICELLADGKVALDVSMAKYFCEKAQSLDPHNPSVFALKELLVATECKDPDDVTRLLLTELLARPTDINLRIRLLKHLLQSNRIKEAYKHVADVEEIHMLMFCNNLTWYETVGEVLIRYQKDPSIGGNLGYEFWMLWVGVLDKLASLTLDERSSNIKNNVECVSAIFNFDQTLTLAAQNLNACDDRQLVQEFLGHYTGQLCFHLATLMCKHAKKGFLNFKEVRNIVLPLIFAAYHSQPTELNDMSFKHTSATKQALLKRWHKEAAYRCSQAGHIILAGIRDRKHSIIEKAILHSSGLWREQLFKKLFVTREQQQNIDKSYFVSCSQLADIVIKTPEPNDIRMLDNEAQLLYPDSLHHYIWLCLNQDLQMFKCSTFSGMQYSVKDLQNCAAETINILDIQAFIYCASLCAQADYDKFKQTEALLLPAAVTEQLGTLNQAKWLTAVYKMYNNEYDANLSEIRLKLIQGIEVVRCVRNHGLDVNLLVKLANAFTEYAKSLSSQTEIEHCEARAELYWKTALPLLERIKNNQICTYKGPRLFAYKTKEMTLRDVNIYIDSGKLFIASQLMKQKEHEKALKLLEQLKDPYATYYQANIYKAIAEEQESENMTTQMRTQYLILLTKARDSLYLTLDRLRDPSVDRKHPLNTKLGQEIEEIEHRLASVEAASNASDYDTVFDESELTVTSENLTPNYSFSQNSILNGSVLNSRTTSQVTLSTPNRRDQLRTEARPSPERLDAQLRQLIISKDIAISQIMDQNRIIVDSHRSLVDELKGFREAVKGLTSAVGELQTIKNTVEELKGIKDTVEDLKNSVDELQNLRNVTDVVSEMKKELTELKKDTHKGKSAQLSDEDLYPLDEDFGNDYNIGSSVTGFNPNLYPQGRIPGPLGYGPPTLYSPMYPMAAYHYGLGLPQTGAPPFGLEQQIAAEIRAMNSLPHNLSQNALPQASYNQSMVPPFASANLNSASLLPNQPLGPFKEVKPEPALPTTTIIPPLNISATVSSHLFPSTTASSVSSGIKAAPVNVVITASDPLPTSKSMVTQPVLSVTIPPQHLKGNLPTKSQPHSYQIPLPAASVASVSTPSVLNQSPLPISTHSILSNVAPPVYSAIADKTANKSTGLGLQIEKSLSQGFSSNPNETKNDLNKSNASISSVEEVDPCPDFKPIIPLPEEVPVNTGEENEKVLFCERAKLFRYVNKEWKERGVGNIKILHNPETKTVRILMRRDQVHKICANHFLTTNMTLAPMPSSDRAFVWAANDYADQELVLEKLCVKFKTPEEANKFQTAFEEATKLLSNQGSQSIAKPAVVSKAADIKPITTAATLGGFVFTSTPTFMRKDDKSSVETKIPETTKASPFADFNFGNKTSAANPLFTSFKSNFTPVEKETTLTSPQKATNNVVPVSPGGDDFVPTAEFKPVVPLPAIVDVKTGEENAEVLFESHAKLLRYDSASKEWKERGIGNMKILKEATIVRLLMRREQIHKVCCNHQLLKNMNFTKMPNNRKALNWCAQDFSEEVLKTEMFALRFKTEEEMENFLSAVQAAQASLNDYNVLSDKSTEKKEDRNQHAKLKVEPEKLTVSPPNKSSWGEKFKPKSGSWNCKTCYIINEGKDNYCVACETPKNDTLPKKDNGASGPMFSFSIPSFTAKPDSSTEQPKTNVAFQTKESVQKETVGFGDAFKPKAGSWSCKTCYVRNDEEKLYCASCECPKDDTVPRKQPSGGINLTPSGATFKFGMPSTETASKTTDPPKFSFGQQTTQPPTGFVFGAATLNKESPVNLTNKQSVFPEPSKKLNEEQEPKDSSKEKFVFGLPQKHAFEFTPRSPRRISGGQGEEESDGSFVEEEVDNIYFKPVIPLPDKVEVKTGEEDEKVLFCHRAKLFRFIDGEWKERGIGDVKILMQPDSKKLRVLMRREQVLKICLNHVLSAEIEYRSKDDKTWLFCAPDFSEGEINRQQFCLRFKTAELAQAFKKAVENALEQQKDKNERSAVITADDTDVEVVYETKVTPEEEKEALKLGLPPKFFAYKQLRDCKCEQCKKDDVYLKELFETVEEKSPATSLNDTTLYTTPKSIGGNSLVRSPSTTITSPFLTPNANVFSSTKTPTSSSSVIPNSTPEAKTIEQLLIKPSAFGNLFTNNSTPIADAAVPKTDVSNAFKSFTFALNPTQSTALSSSTTTDTPKPFFGGETFAFGTQTKSSFGLPAATTSNVFGLGSMSTTSNRGLFGSATTTATTNISDSNGSLFTTSNTSLFSSPTADNKENQGSIFGSPAVLMKKTSVEKPLESLATSSSTKAADDKQDVILPSDPNLTFASLAAARDKPIFGKSTDDGKNPFEFLGAGAPVFGKTTKEDAKGKTVSQVEPEEQADSEGDGAEEHDPHYEPIIPLPATIVVSTGEEEESSLFNERAKLFRYDVDNKEWKERGVGQMKLLHHPVNNTYRLLLRREQVHKVVLNQLITADLELQPMSTSDKAWLWGGYNYTDDGSYLEKLAARFKNTEIANQFYEVVQKAIKALKEIQDSKCLPSTVQDYLVENISGDENQHSGDDEVYDEDEDEEDADEDDKSVMCMKRCTLSEKLESGEWKNIAMGDILIYYDPELYCAKISLNDNSGHTVSNTVIGVNTVMEINNKECWWRAVEWASQELRWKTLKATFSSAAAAQEFYCSYKEGVNLAQQFDIVDEIPTEHSEEID